MPDEALRKQAFAAICNAMKFRKEPHDGGIVVLTLWEPGAGGRRSNLAHSIRGIQPGDTVDYRSRTSLQDSLPVWAPTPRTSVLSSLSRAPARLFSKFYFEHPCFHGIRKNRPILPFRLEQSVLPRFGMGSEIIEIQ